MTTGQLDLFELLARPAERTVFLVGHPGRDERGCAIYPMVTWGCGVCGTADTDPSLQHGANVDGTFRSVNYAICRPCAEAHCESPAEPGCIGRAIHDGRLTVATHPDHKLQPTRWQGCLQPGPRRPGEQWWTGWDHVLPTTV